MRVRSYRRAARRAVSASVAPYGYTLTVWTSGAVLTHARGIPSTFDALLFMVGAVTGFAVVGAGSLGGLGARDRVEPQGPALWSGLHVLSVGVPIGLATVIAHLVEDPAAWPLGGFAITTGYLVVLAAQLALAS